MRKTVLTLGFEDNKPQRESVPPLQTNRPDAGIRGNPILISVFRFLPVRRWTPLGSLFLQRSPSRRDLRPGRFPDSLFPESPSAISATSALKPRPPPRGLPFAA